MHFAPADDRVRMREFYDAVAEGKDGFRAGMSNPHPPGTMEHNAWWIGFNDERAWSTMHEFQKWLRG